MARKITRTRADLDQELTDRLDLLKTDAATYDSGKEIAAKSFATGIRIMVHDTAVSHSLLRQLGRKGDPFLDTALPIDSKSFFSYSGLLAASMGPGGCGFKPHLENHPEGGGKLIPFEDWWNATVFRDQQGNTFSRKQLVLALANQDGGAHVDPQLDEVYHKLTRQNSLGWSIKHGDEPWKAVTNPHYAAVRQIAHELLKSVVPGYTAPQSNAPGGEIRITGVSLGIRPAPPSSPP